MLAPGATADDGSGEDLTVAAMPNQRPPRTTRHGSLHAAQRRPLPVRPDAPTPNREHGEAPGAGVGSRFALPTPMSAPSVPVIVVTHRLDRGRLTAARLVSAARFGVHRELTATLAGPGRAPDGTAAAVVAL